MTDKPDPPARFVIARAKVLSYLLDPDHPDGGGKCKFLGQFGFLPEYPRDLFIAIDMHRTPDNFRGVSPGHRSIKLYFEGPLISPGAENPHVRTVWQLDDEDDTRTARFITLKPLSKLPRQADDDS